MRGISKGERRGQVQLRGNQEGNGHRGRQEGEAIKGSGREGGEEGEGVIRRVKAGCVRVRQKGLAGDRVTGG